MRSGKRQRKKANGGRRRRLAFYFILFFLLFCGIKNGVGIISRLSLGGGNVNIFSERLYPDSLVKLAKDNPETKQFVRNYPEKKDITGKIDVSQDLTGGIPLFLQWDERWGYRKYGGNFMALTGCGPTCLAMVSCGLTGDSKWNPYRVAVMAEKKGYYVKGQGSSWDLMTNGAAEIGLRAESVVFDKKHICEILQQGKPIICVVGPGDFTTQGHFLVLTGVDSDGKIQLHDPNSRKRSEKSWELENLMTQIRNLWTYSVK